MPDLTVSFNLQTVLKEMEDRLTKKMDDNATASSIAHSELRTSVKELDAKLDSYNLRLTSAETDIKNAKRLAGVGLTGMIGLIVDTARRHLLG